MRLSIPVLLIFIASGVLAKKSKPAEQIDQNYPLKVELKSKKGSLVTVKVTNKGKDEINLFTRANILDPNPVRKVNLVSADGDSIAFIGAHARIQKEGLSKKSFQTVKKGKTAEVTFDVADLYDISMGGNFTVNANGSIPWAKKKSTNLVATAPFTSNDLRLQVDRAFVKPKVKTILDADCVAGRADATRNANAVCAFLANNAALAARNGDPGLFERYFRTQDPNLRNLVANRFEAVARECSSQTNIATTYCADEMQLCRSDYISVTWGTKITNCDLFWRFPTVTDQCHGYDQATLTIHETTHVEGVFDPSTVDFPNNYGWPALTYLDAGQAVTNADNYQYFANAAYVRNGC